MHSTIPHVGNYQNYSFNNQQALLSHKNKLKKLGGCKSQHLEINWNICFLGFFSFTKYFLSSPWWNLFPPLKTFGYFLLRSFSPWLNFSPVYFPSFPWPFFFLAKPFKKYFLSVTDQIYPFPKKSFLHSFFLCLPDKINSLIHQTLSPFSLSHSPKMYNMASLFGYVSSIINSY